MKAKNLVLALTLLISFTVLSCTGTPDTFTVEEIDGVRHVHNLSPLWGDEPKVKLEFVQKIGELNTEDKNYLLYRPSAAAVDKNGNIYILDGGNHRIQKYDKAGKYLATIGRRGQGPGEFEDLTNIGIFAENYLYASDVDVYKIEIYNLNGKLIRGFRFHHKPYENIIQNNGNVIVQHKVAGTIEDNYLLTMLDPEGNEIKKIGEIPISEDESDISPRDYAWMAKDDNDNIYVNFWYKNRIRKYSADGEFLLDIDRELPQIPGMNRYKNTRWSTDFSMGIGVDHKDRIWSLTVNRNKGEHEEYQDYKNNPGRYDLEIYREDGVLLQRIRLEILPTDLSVTGDRIFIIDAVNEMCVREYRIMEK